jgi:hypothetical protein
MGGMQRRGHADDAHNLLNMCVSPHLLQWFPIPMTWQTAQASFTGHRSRRHSMSCSALPTFYLYLQHLPLTACSATLQHQYVTHSRSPISRRRSTATASSCQRVGTAGETLWLYATTFDAKTWGEAWERNLLSGAGIDSDNDDGTRKLLHPSCKAKAPKYVTYYLPTFPTLSSRVKRAAVPAPTPQQPDARTNFSRQDCDENARRADRDPCGIFRTPTYATTAPTAGLVRSLGSSSFSLLTVSRALAEMEGRVRRRLYSGVRRAQPI